MSLWQANSNQEVLLSTSTSALHLPVSVLWPPPSPVFDNSLSWHVSFVRPCGFFFFILSLSEVIWVDPPRLKDSNCDINVYLHPECTKSLTWLRGKHRFVISHSHCPSDKWTNDKGLHHTRSLHIFKMFLHIYKSQRNEIETPFCLHSFFGIIKLHNNSKDKYILGT